MAGPRLRLGTETGKVTVSHRSHLRTRVSSSGRIAPTGGHQFRVGGRRRRLDAGSETSSTARPDACRRAGWPFGARHVSSPEHLPGADGDGLGHRRQNGSPSELLARLERLPPASYHTVHEVWTALGEPTESRTPEAAAPPTAEPAPTASASAPAHPAPSIWSVPGWIDGAAKCAGRLTELMVRVVLGGTVAAVTVSRRRLRH